MKLPRFGDRDRRALGLGGLLVVPALLFAVVVKPYAQALGAARDQVSTQRDLLQREFGLLDVASRFPDRLAAAGSALRMDEPRLFTGFDGHGATAALARYVGETAEESRVLIEQVETREAQLASAGILELHISVQARSDLEGVLALLGALESGEKLVSVEQLTVERVHQGSMVSERDDEILRVGALIIGYAAQAPGDSALVSPPASAAEVP